MPSWRIGGGLTICALIGRSVPPVRVITAGRSRPIVSGSEPAARTGQVLNLVDLARDAGVSPPTARQWLSVLEASHQVFFLRPHFENLGKRLIKAPKLYWLDTGMVCFLLGLKDEEAVLRGPMAGALFETAMVTELAKCFYHRGLPPALWYWRSRDGWEVDLLIELQGKLHPMEIKATATPRPAPGGGCGRVATCMPGRRRDHGCSSTWRTTPTR